MAKRKGSNTGILGLSFSWKRALGLTRAKQSFAKMTGIPTTKAGRQRKIGRIVTGGGCLLPIIYSLITIVMIAVFFL